MDSSQLHPTVAGRSGLWKRQYGYKSHEQCSHFFRKNRAKTRIISTSELKNKRIIWRQLFPGLPEGLPRSFLMTCHSMTISPFFSLCSITFQSFFHHDLVSRDPLRELQVVLPGFAHRQRDHRGIMSALEREGCGEQDDDPVRKRGTRPLED
jgi:hypothetical protein